MASNLKAPSQKAEPGSNTQIVYNNQTIIEPTSGWSSLGLGDLREYRELLYFMVLRDIKGRYRQMALGPLWVIIQPLVQMILFSLVFGYLAGLPSEGIPYPLFTYVALIPWLFFANSTRRSSQSLVEQRHIISKVYFPRLIIPLSAVLSSLVDFLASFLVLIVMMFFFKVTPTIGILTIPFFLFLAAATSLAVGLWLAGLSVIYRDVALGVGLGLEVWKFLTPVVYSITLIPEQWQKVYYLNPMTIVVEGFRWALLGTTPPPTWAILVTLGLIFSLLLSGTYYFRRTERTIVDLI